MRRDEYSRRVNYELNPPSRGGYGATRCCTQLGGEDGGRETIAQRNWGPIYVSAKRTQIIFVDLLLYPLYFQKLMPFAATFANGFVLEERTHFREVLRWV